MGEADDRSGDDSLLRAVAHAPEATPAAGTLLAGKRVGRFRVLRKLGAGGMGVVYEAEDERLGRRVALKVLQRADDADARARFVREARSASQVTHPNAAVVYEAGEDGDVAFIAMELVEGETLDAWLRASRPVRERLRVAREIASAVAKAHDLGIVHRDLKPGNVMIARAGAAKVLDFGLAKQQVAAIDAEGATTATATLEGRLVGTPSYMSPEQVQGKSVDARSDVFSLGVVLYEMLGGRRPFAGLSPAELLAAILRDAPEPLRRRAPDVPAGLAAIVDRCLAKAPDDRWSSARELLAALEAVPASGAAAPEKARSRAWLVPALLVTVGAIVAAGLLARPKAADVPPAPVTSASAAASARVRALTEWPPPRTSSAEAATLYAEGLQALRDASIVQFRNDLLRAVALDPHLASAQLRLAINSWVHEDQLEHLAAANQARASLDARDARLLSFVDATTRGYPDVEKGFAAARDLARDLPDDPEALWWAGVDLKWSDQHDAARAMFERAVELDPKFAVAEFGIAEIATLWGDPDAQLAASERCLAIAPRAATCLAFEADVHDARGECGDVEQEARDIVAIDPAGWGGYDPLMSALAAEGAPPEAIAELATKEAASMAEPAKARWVADANGANVALLRGDLSAAEASLLALQKDESGLAGDDAHRAEGELIALYDEEGERGKAADVAAAYLQKLPSWTHDVSGPVRSRAAWALRRSGRLSAGEATALRDRWAADASKHGSWWQVKQFWFSLYASGVETGADAREARAALPAFSPLPALGTAPGLQGELAVVRALTGDVDGAVPGLRTATAACSSWVNMRYWSGYHSGDDALFDSMRERLLLGQVLEKKDDAAGACAQYAAILARWGHAKPRSVTADRARARSKVLGCK